MVDVAGALTLLVVSLLLQVLVTTVIQLDINVFVYMEHSLMFAMEQLLGSYRFLFNGGHFYYGPFWLWSETSTSWWIIFQPKGLSYFVVEDECFFGRYHLAYIHT